MFGKAASTRFMLNPFNHEKESERAIDNRYRSPGKQLFEAILRNRLYDVKVLLEDGADPNVSLAIIRSHLVVTPDEHEDRPTALDNVFLWKKLFGESPTPVHIAVMNVYHCNQSHRDLETALKILKLLLQHGGDVGLTSNNMFLRRKMIATNPLDLALGVQRMTLWMNIEKAETAMVKAVEIMRQHYDPTKPIVRSHSVPFELVSLKLLDRVEHLLFAPSRNAKHRMDITFVSSDVEYPVLDQTSNTATTTTTTTTSNNGIARASSEKAMMVRV